MASRKEERERLRQAREQAMNAEQSRERKRLILGYAVAGLISAAVIAGIVVVIAGGGDGGGGGGDLEAAGVDQRTGVVPSGLAVDDRDGTPPEPVSETDLEAAAQAADCTLREDLRDEGNTHLPPNADVPNYATNPPTSGDHSPEPLADGAYADFPSPLNFIHSLEHGRVLIQYSPDLPDEAQLELKGVFELDPDGMLLFPNPQMPHAVAATAWTQLLACETYEGQATLDAVQAFRDKWRGRGPEAVPL